MTQGPNLVLEWLSKLHLAQYVESFIDNGYDDLEVCKQIGEPDLDAIGVHIEYHRHRLLTAVQTLKEEDKRKTPSYYFTLEPLDPSACKHSPHPDTENDSRTPRTAGIHQASCPGNHNPRVTDCNDFVTYPKLKLKVLIRDKLAKDGINLGEAPYTFKLKLNGLVVYPLCGRRSSCSDKALNPICLEDDRVVSEKLHYDNVHSEIASIRNRVCGRMSWRICDGETAL
ncbi:Sterile alpha motif domain-containing protein 5 [Nibea albiflora]|uniref:Sterile alpha motif domain-containing protein 5 n=1 Tax=Nibea albiflora TaxID=240163 RepID=A0ACB7FFP4_NIBAL|nr:Sterile alpha motif domain-containing protein 5 [Nibea albiflora]